MGYTLPPTYLDGCWGCDSLAAECMVPTGRKKMSSVYALDVHHHERERPPGHLMKQYERWRWMVIATKLEVGGRCQRCGYAKSLAGLVFHHRDPRTKARRGTDARLKFAHGSSRWVEHVLEHCELICRNCHAEEHHGCLVA